MQLIIKLHPEITIKSESVRKRFTKLLQGNIRQCLKRQALSADVRNQWDKLVVLLPEKTRPKLEAVLNVLQRIPGIVQIQLVEETSYADMHDIYLQVKDLWGNKLAGKTFAVRVKRKGQHDFSSTDVARYVGGGLNQHCETGGVRLKQPDVTVKLEINQDKLLLVKSSRPGMGGMPIPTQEDVLCLMSGGFDSGVASYQMMRRGARTHFVFFNLGGREHEIGVRAVSQYLWQQYSSSHRVKFVAVDFAPVVAEILDKVENSQMGVVLKRMMLRAAEQVANGLQINALVTGECLGQVSSQTLSNLHVIDEVTSKLVLRPLICADKNDIITIARQIGTEDFAASMPEYCGVISRKPTVKAQLDSIVAEEAKMDMQIIQQVVHQAMVEDIRKVVENGPQALAEVASQQQVSQQVVLDIRASEEQEASPLHLPGVEVLHLPFFRLGSQFASLDQSKDYLLYCQRGLMSQMQAQLLHEQGYQNVQVYQPD